MFRIRGRLCRVTRWGIIGRMPDHETYSTLTPTTAGLGNAAQVAKRRSRRITAAYFAAFVLLGLTSASLGPTLKGLAQHTAVTLEAISIVFTARALGYTLGSLSGGRLYDRYSGHAVLALVLGAIAAAAFLIPAMQALWPLAFLMVALGAAEGALDVGCNTLLVWQHGSGVGPFMNGLHFFFGLGAFISPLVVARVLALSGEIRWAYWVLGLAAVPVALFVARLPSPPSRVTHSGEGQKPIPWKSVALVGVFFFLYVGAEVGFGGWVYLYALDQLGMDPASSAAFITAAFWGALTLGRLLSIPVGRRFSAQAVLLADLGGCLVSIGVVLAFPSAVWAMWLGTLGLGASMASIFPATLTLAEKRMPITGRVTGLFFVGVGAGGMLLPWVVGQLYESAGPRSMVFAVALALVLALGVFMGLRKMHRRV